MSEMLSQIETVMIRGGIMMIPLAICSVIVVAITLERLYVLRLKRQVSRKNAEEWRAWLNGFSMSDSRPKPKSHSITGRVLTKTTGLLPMSKKRLEERLTDLARIEKHRLERGLVLLDTIAGIAPLFGLLGTALGMVEVFSRLSLMDEAKMNALSSGISQALFTTVAGLMIGIPSLIAFNLFTRRVEGLMLAAEEQINGFVDDFPEIFTVD